MNIANLRLYLVTDSSLSLGRPLDWVVEEAVKGGATMVQLREKEADSRTFYELAVRLKQKLALYNVPLIINDRLDIALAVDADGLHIGQSDLPYAVARRLLGADKIIGLSVENAEDVLDANKLDVDYIGLSPIFNTLTKVDTAPELGLAGIVELTNLSKHPSVAIGGISATNTPAIIQNGADGIAVVSAIMSAPDPEEAAMQLRHLVDMNLER